jgi:phosphate transport system permease protein
MRCADRCGAATGTGLAVLATVLVVAPLVAIFVYLVYKGASSLNLAFFTHNPKPVGETGGGMANAIGGSAILLGVGSLIGIPIGIAGGIFLAEFGRGTKLANAVRFTADVLNGVPSIVMGIAAYSLVVVPQGHFSAFSGGVALGIMMIPTVCRTTEEMLLMVPNAVREAALALGVPNWRSVLAITVKTASAGIITGCMLAFARVAGETAPLIFTAFGNAFWSEKLSEPIAALAVADLRVRNLTLRGMAPAGVGRSAGLDCADCAGGLTGALRDQPRRFERGKLKWASASR